MKELPLNMGHTTQLNTCDADTEAHTSPLGITSFSGMQEKSRQKITGVEKNLIIFEAQGLFFTVSIFDTF